MPDYDQLAYNLRKSLSVYFPSLAASLDLGRGTALPTTGHDGAAIQTNARFFRTDLGWRCYYDGTRWLTMHEYEINMTPFGGVFPYSGGSPATILLTPSRADFSYYLEGARSYTLVSTTNDGSNYWSFQLLDDNTTNLWSFSTSGQAAGAGTLQAQGVMGAVTLSSFLNLNIVGKTGAPGALSVCNVSVWCKLVVT